MMKKAFAVFADMGVINTLGGLLLGLAVVTLAAAVWVATP
jgi:uncharacterized membrane protein